MKYPIRHRLHNDRGSLLISAAVAATIIAILITGMLIYISNEYRLNLRSHRWTQGLYLAEAGIEMCFAEYNNYQVISSNAFSSTRGWVNEGWDGYGITYSKTVSAFTNSAGEIVGSLSNRVERVGTFTPYVKAFASCTTTPNGPIIYRGLKCHLRTSSSFPAGMVAKKKIDTNGKQLYTDSYDSLDGSKSTGSRYDLTKRQAHGDVASNESITNTVDVSVGNASIYGQVLLSPSGSVTMGPGGSVGTSFLTRDTTVGAGQTDGSIRNDFAVDIPGAQLPSGAGTWTSQGNINNDLTLVSGDYRASGINIKNSENLVINGDVRLYVTGDIAMAGSSTITINPGATLVIYVTGNTQIAGNGVLNNSTSDVNLRLYALQPTGNQTQTVDIKGNGNWNGVVYAPYADVTLTGGGANGDMSGAIVANTITLNGQVQFHYDEALRHSNIFGSFDIASWRSMHRVSSNNTWVNDY